MAVDLKKLQEAFDELFEDENFVSDFKKWLAQLTEKQQSENNKDWDVVSYGVGIPAPILKVRRKSDNEVFAQWEVIEQGQINGFSFEEETGFFIHVHNGKTSYSTVYRISDIQKKKPKQPLFTTEDGKSIYEGDEFWAVQHRTYDLLKCSKPLGKPEWWWLFSTKEKAEEYIILNKPCLSLNEVSEWLCNGLQSSLIVSKLKPLVIRKLK